MSIENGNAPSSVYVPRRRWWRDVALGIMLFACGCVVGGVAVTKIHRHRVLGVSQNGIDRERTFARLERALELNEAQASKVRSIVGKGLDDLRTIRQSARPAVETTLQRVRTEVSAVLDDAQKQKWESRFDQLRERWLPPLAGGGTR